MLTVFVALLSIADVAAPSEPRRIEVWLQPVGTFVWSATSGIPFISIGATASVARGWEIVAGASIASAPLEDWDEFELRPAWQVWASLAPVRFFRQAHSKNGFFIGPKVSFSVIRTSGGFWNDGYGKPWGAQSAFDIELSFDLGYRFQFGHFCVTLVAPALSVGYAWHDGDPFDTSPGPLTIYRPLSSPIFPNSRNGFVYGIDLDILRLGIAW